MERILNVHCIFKSSKYYDNSEIENTNNSNETFCLYTLNSEGKKTFLSYHEKHYVVIFKPCKLQDRKNQLQITNASDKNLILIFTLDIHN